MNATKDVTIKKDTYQIVRFTPQDGSWIVVQLLSKALLAGISGKIDPDNLAAILPLVFEKFTEDDFRSLQHKCFGVCRIYKAIGEAAPIPQPLLMQDGRWAVEEPDLITALALTINALVFNLEPFFEDGALEALMESLPALKSPAPQTSMASSSAPS